MTISIEPWRLELKKLAQALQDSGKEIPPGHYAAVETVPEDQRDANGRPMFRIVIKEMPN
jgi:hypothetical protein